MPTTFYALTYDTIGIWFLRDRRQKYRIHCYPIVQIYLTEAETLLDFAKFKASRRQLANALFGIELPPPKSQ